MKQWYEELFSNFAKKYDNEVFTKGTLQEVDFIEQEIAANKKISILDVGCGTGRHSIELAKRGHQVTGIDLSDNMLERARQKASESGVKVNYQQADARDFHFDEKFDMVIMLCEGGFSLMETDEMNFNILKNASACLNAKGKFIFTCLNALFPLYHSVKDLIDEGTTGVHNGKFDIMQFREFSDYDVKDDDGKSMALKCNERYYAPSEIRFMLSLLGFTKIEIFGCGIGNFKRNRLLETNDYEMLVIAEK